MTSVLSQRNRISQKRSDRDRATRAGLHSPEAPTWCRLASTRTSSGESERSHARRVLSLDFIRLSLNAGNSRKTETVPAHRDALFMTQSPPARPPGTQRDNERLSERISSGKSSL